MDIILLAKLEVGGRSLLEGTGKGFSVRLPPRVLSCSKRQKIFSFCDMRNDSTLPSLFIRPQRSTAGYGVLQ